MPYRANIASPQKFAFNLPQFDDYMQVVLLTYKEVKYNSYSSDIRNYLF